MNITGIIIGIVLAGSFSGILIWIVGLLGLGLQVDGFTPAFITGFAIATVGGVITLLISLRNLSISSELLRFVVNVLVGAVVIFISGRFLPGLQVNGFLGAVVASLAIGVIALLLSLPLKRKNKAAELKEKEAGNASK